METTFSVLLIDDNAIDNMIHTKVLEQSTLSDVVYLNQSGIGALDFLKNVGKIKATTGHNYIPEYIFLDLDMPIMDGFQFMRSFEKLGEEITKGIKIVILTASDKVDNRDLPKKHKNFHRYLVKPLTLDKIDSLVECYS